MILPAVAQKSGSLVCRMAVRLQMAWNSLLLSPAATRASVTASASSFRLAQGRLQNSGNCCGITMKSSKTRDQSNGGVCINSPPNTRGDAVLTAAAVGVSVCALGWQDRRDSSSTASSTVAYCATRPTPRGSHVYAWGSNIDGQVGVGSALSVSHPAVLYSLHLRPDETVISVSGGLRHSACVTSEGRVFSWGRGAEGDYGVPSTAEGPKEILMPLEKGDRPVSVSCGNGFSLVVTQMGCLYSWGNNSHGQCGRPPHDSPPGEQELGSNVNNSLFGGFGSRDVFGGRTRSPSCLPPGEVGGALASQKVVSAACGGRMCAAVTANGEIFVWGDVRTGGTLRGNKTEEGKPQPHEPRLVALPAEEGGPARAVAVACGESHCVALSERGFVYTWGNNFYGQLGLGGGPRTVEGPQLVSALKDEHVASVACGAQHSLCLTEDGKVFVWGYGKDGQCAEPTHQDVPLPLQVDFGGPAGTPSTGRCTQISGGEGHSLALCGKGKIFVWGRGREGQLGRGGLVESPAASRDAPVEVTFGDGEQVVLAACGGCHTLAATKPSNE